jgi:hypothetical protein
LGLGGPELDGLAVVALLVEVVDVLKDNYAQFLLDVGFPFSHTLHDLQVALVVHLPLARQQ